VSRAGSGSCGPLSTLDQEERVRHASQRYVRPNAFRGIRAHKLAEQATSSLPIGPPAVARSGRVLRVDHARV
jgi:hypothetical protein